MTIATLRKVTVCGLVREKDAILNDLQTLGVMHLLPLRPPPKEEEKILPERPEATLKALRFLVETPDRRRQMTREDGFDVEKVTADVLALKQRLREATDRRDFLKKRIADIAPWGEIVYPPLADLSGERLWFYVLPVRQSRAIPHIRLPFEVVHRNARHAYIVVIAPEEPPRDLLPVPRVHLGARPLSALRRDLEDTEIEIEALEAERIAMTRWIHLLTTNLDRAEDRALLARAGQLVHADEALLAVQGWVPVSELGALDAFVRQHRLATLVEEPRPDEEPPTLLLGADRLAAGEDLATFYQIPRYGTWDPSIVLIGSFAVFFGMILADAGYGLILLLVLFLYWRTLGETAHKRSWRLAGLLLSGAAIVYGVLTGSYFGVSPPPGSVFAGFQALRIDDFETMMRLSIVIGVLHLTLANVARALADRRRSVVLSSAGWIAVLYGGLLLWLTGGAAIGTVLLAGGFLAVFAFASDRRLDGPLAVVLRAVDGFRALTGSLGLFGDVLSYMRLFALGLASASLAVTFNGLAANASAAMPGLGLLVALLILLVGHGLNFALAIMSGVVHGLRLNFIEFYRWGMDGEGHPFHRFARKEGQE